MSKKISIDTIGFRTRDLPACSTVPQPTAPPRAVYEVMWKNTVELDIPEVANAHSVLDI
jgi:hypothetical protein